MRVSLQTVIDTLGEGGELEALLSSFSCQQDEDIERFLHSRAVEFEKLSKSRTYLIFDLDELKTKDIADQTIYGYFALSLKVLTVPESTSNRTRKELDGLSSKIHGEVISSFPCYLIGQLARNSRVPGSAISGAALFSFARDIILNSAKNVGGRYMLIECKDEAKLIRFYTDIGFTKLASIPDQEKRMIQMIRKI